MRCTIFFGKLILTGCCLVTRTVKVILIIQGRLNLMNNIKIIPNSKRPVIFSYAFSPVYYLSVMGPCSRSVLMTFTVSVCQNKLSIKLVQRIIEAQSVLSS